MKMNKNECRDGSHWTHVIGQSSLISSQPTWSSFAMHWSRRHPLVCCRVQGWFLCDLCPASSGTIEQIMTCRSAILPIIHLNWIGRRCIDPWVKWLCPSMASRGKCCLVPLQKCLWDEGWWLHRQWSDHLDWHCWLIKECWFSFFELFMFVCLMFNEKKSVLKYYMYVLWIFMSVDSINWLKKWHSG